MEHPLRALDRFWFFEAPATRLALVRIVVGGYALYSLGDRFTLFTRVAATSPTLFEPVGPASVLAAPIPVTAFQILLILTVILNVMFLLGWMHKFSGPLFGLLLLWVLSYRNSWSMIFHTDNLLVLHAVVLGFTRSADAVSLDALRGSTAPGRRFGHLGRWSLVGGRIGWQYGYPIRLLCLVTALTYFLSGVAKLAGPLGASWAVGESLRTQIAFDVWRKELLVADPPTLIYGLYDQIGLFSALAIGTLALELGAPLAILSGWLAAVWVPGTFLMHWGILLLMGIEFPYQLSGVAFVSFIPLDRAARRLDPRRALSSVASIRFRDLASRFRWSPRRVGPLGGLLLISAPLLLAVSAAIDAPPARASHEMAALDGHAPIDEQALGQLAYERARLGARWLSQRLRSSGKFYYIYDPHQDRYKTDSYNPVRHAGVTYSLFQAHGAFGDRAMGETAERAARFIVDSSPVVEDGRRAFVFAGRTKLGAQALALVALLERRRVTGDANYDDQIRELAEFMLSMELEDEPGRYYQSYLAEAGARLLTPDSNYYPGEALLALVRLADQFPDGPYLDYAVRAARYLVHVRDGDIPTVGVVPREDHWLTMALAELHQKRPDPAYATVVYLQAESMLSHQYTPEDDNLWAVGASRLRNPVNYTSTATKAEALIAAWELAARRGDGEMASRAADGARRAVQFLMRVQHTQENTAGFPRPDRLIGAWGQDALKPYVRMDFVQHNVSALLGVWRLTGDVDAFTAQR